MNMKVGSILLPLDKLPEMLLPGGPVVLEADELS